jgi:RHS repeat-associated protein
VCWLEILPAPLDAQGQPLTVPAATVQAMATLIAKATAQTGASPKPTNIEKEFAYLDYVDEVVAYQQTVNGVTKRYYPHYNHLYSVAALTGDPVNGVVPVVERYKYDAYGRQTITSDGGVARSKSAVGFDRSFTGYTADSETGLLHARARQYSPTLGRFVSRDSDPGYDGDDGIVYGNDIDGGIGYNDGYSLYQSYYVPNNLDPTGYSMGLGGCPAGLSPCGAIAQAACQAECEAAGLLFNEELDRAVCCSAVYCNGWQMSYRHHCSCYWKDKNAQPRPEGNNPGGRGGNGKGKGGGGKGKGGSGEPKGAHDKNKREGNREKHEDANSRRKREQERADERRRNQR